MIRPIILFTLGLLALAAVLPASAPAEAGQGVAMVADLHGAVTRSGRPLDLLMEIPDGTELVLGDGAAITLLALADGTETVVTGPGTAIVGATAVSPAGGATATSSKPRVAALSLRPDDYQQAAVVMRGAAQATVSGLSPDGGVVLGPPVLAWSGADGDPGAAPCTVVVDDATGERVHEASVEGPSLALPADLPVAAGETLRWALSCPGLDRRDASFTLAEAGLAARFLSLRPAADAPFAERVAYARALAAAGLEHDSQAAFHHLAIERPASLHLRILANLPLDGPVPPLP
jgi:hypothetical protein